MPPHRWRDLAGLLLPFRARLASGILISILQCATALPMVWLIRRIFDRSAGAAPSLSLPVSGLYLVTFAIITAGLGILGQLLIQQAVKSAIARFRKNLLEHIYALPKASHDARERTRLHDLAIPDTERVEGLLLAVAGQMIPNGAVAAILASALAVRSPALFLVLLATLPIIYLLSRTSLRRCQEAAAATRRALGNYSRALASGLRNLELVWLHNGGPRELAAHAERIDILGTVGVQATWRIVVHQRIQQLSYLGISAIVLIIGSRAVERGSITSGDLLSFYALAALTLNYVRDAGLGIGSVVLGREPWLNLHAFLSLPTPVTYPGSRRIGFSGTISLRNISFQYTTPGRERSILKGLSLDLNPGRFTALTGANGSGKSTLLQLILGLYRPDSGSLLADGIPYTELDVADLRRQIGVVAQDPPLITGTIRDNIAYARPDAPSHEIEAAARTALAHAFIQQLPKGYDTEVGEHGILLSGGQRQRLALARALLIHSPLLILDEPTNHVDQEGVRDLLLSLRSLHPSPAILVITHVPAVLALADEAWTLADSHLMRNPLPAQ
jgi:ATP-binding cassette subfamily B protein